MSEKILETNATSSETTKETEILPGYTSIEQFTKEGFKVLMEAIRHSNSLPTGRDWNFYKLSDSFSQIMNDEGSNVLRLMNQIMRCNEIESNIRNRVLDEKTELVVEANDIILEKVANNIDEMNGVRKTLPEPVIIQTVSAQLPVNGSWNRPTTAIVTVNSAASEAVGKNCIKLITAKNIIRPQKFFKDKIENDHRHPWCPRIKEKPNSLKPLAIFLEEFENRQEYSHPYEFELDRFAPLPEQLLEETPEFPKDLSQTPLVEINKPEQLDDLVESLRNCKEFAVDLEHHSYRSFMGITCLLQITTKDADYLIDTLALRDKLCILNEVFTKNSIVKIFHGADKDVEWLQRDLSIYVVNMFDTHQAAKALEYSGLSLAFLMKKFCNVNPNKQFQLADWRIRPLPEEFKTYAREDTHYLIYIYKMLKKELLFKGKGSDHILRSVIDHSTEICKKRYFKPILRDDSHLEVYRRCKKMFDNRQLYALKEIYAWRDNLAREEDESLAYVLPNHMLIQISEALPREMQGILACCNPIPPLVRSHLLELHQIVLKAREQPLERAILQEETTGRGILKKISKINVDSILHCPHDLSKSNEFRDDLPTLLFNKKLKVENENIADTELLIEKPPSYSVFDNGGEIFNERETFKKLRGFNYFSPYERYSLIKPFVEEEERNIQLQKEEMAHNEEQKDDRTDDDRIASIRNHFLQLSKKFNEELEIKKQQEKQKQEERSLIEMGGSRKRKRDFGNDDKQQGNDSLHTPLPAANKLFRNNNRKRKRGKKRKYNEINSCFDNQEENMDNQEQMVGEKRRRIRKRKRDYQQQQEEQSMPPPPQPQHRQNKTQVKKNQIYGQRKNQDHFYQPQIQNDGARRQFVRHQKKKKTHQVDSSFVPYDYASVDFRQFQGGAGSASAGVQIKPSFKGKNRKKMGNKGAKYSTFNNKREPGRRQGKG